MSEPTCKTCGEPIAWGLERGGKWKPLEPSGHGTFVLLNERYVIESRWDSFDAIPESQRARIPAEMREVWRAALDGPRYRLHDRTCAYLQATKLDAKAVL